MKNFIILSVLFFSFNSSFGQCKFKGLPKAFLKFSISDDRPNPDEATRPKAVMEKLDFNGKVSAVKSGDKKYFYFHFVRSSSKKFNINSDDPLELTTKSGKKILLAPPGDFKGKKSLTSYVIGVFYEVSDEQLTTLSNDPVEFLKLNITSNKEINGGINFDGGNWTKDSSGDVSYKTEIKKKSNRDKLLDLARCLKAI